MTATARDGSRMAHGVALALSVLALTSCSADAGSATDRPAAQVAAAEPTGPASGAGASGSSAELIGTSCEAYVEDADPGAPSTRKLARTPTFEALAANPWATRWNAAMTGRLSGAVDLRASLDGEELTLLVPADQGFDIATRRGLREIAGDPDVLFSVLAHHILPGRLTPQALANSSGGRQQTLLGDQVRVTGADDSLRVEEASVLCGPLTTKHGELYLIDRVLVPRER